jgi:hypothetical protein
MKKLILIVSILALSFTLGCKDATRAQFSALGKRHKITLYSGGKVVGEWISTGNVSNQENSDGWYFEDEKTHRLVEVAGTLVIEVIP